MSLIEDMEEVQESIEDIQENLQDQLKQPMY